MRVYQDVKVVFRIEEASGYGGRDQAQDSEPRHWGIRKRHGCVFALLISRVS